MRIQQAVILAGGLGTRLRPITEKIPKPLVEIQGRPFLHWQIEYLKSYGIHNVLMLVSYLGEKIVDYFSRHPITGVQLEFVKESTPLGTGGAIRNAVSQLQEQFWVCNGDTHSEISLNEVGNYFEQQQLRNLIVVYNNPSMLNIKPNLYADKGILLDYNSEGGGQNFNGVDAGIYIMQKSDIEHMPEGNYSMGNILNYLISQKQIAAYMSPIRFYDIGTLERLQTLPKNLFQQRN